MVEVLFNGPAGRLEGRYHKSARNNAPTALILHPHPQYGGTMNNKVVYTLYSCFERLGFSVLRFNFRSVGRSQGEFENGPGELSDATIALDWLQQMNPEARQCWIAGYSFGAWMRSTCPPKAEQTYSVGSGSHIEVVGEKYLLVEFLNSSDGTLGASAVEFAVDTTEWQFACGAAVAPTNYSKIRISAVTKRCIGETIVDGLQLYHETFSQAYSYDEDGVSEGRFS